MDTIVLTFALTMFLGFAVLAAACVYATIATYSDDVAIEDACRDDYVHDTLVCMVAWRKARAVPTVIAFHTPDYAAFVERTYNGLERSAA